MMNFQPELVKFASDEQRKRLWAEAAQWRMLKASEVDRPQAKRSEWSWLRQRLVSLWRWLTQTPIKQQTPNRFSSDFNS